MVKTDVTTIDINLALAAVERGVIDGDKILNFLVERKKKLEAEIIEIDNFIASNPMQYTKSWHSAIVKLLTSGYS